MVIEKKLTISEAQRTTTLSPLLKMYNLNKQVVQIKIKEKTE